MKPPNDIVFFIDRCLGVEPIRTELVNAGLTVEIHDDHFVRDEEDQVWLSAVGSRGWVVLTKDQRLRYRPLERAALQDSGARVFILTAGSLRGSEIASVFLRAKTKILGVLASKPGPFIGYVSRLGLVNVASERRSGV